MCVPCYETGVKPPFLKAYGHGGYLCTHNLLLSHARAYHLYQDKYKATQNGRVGIALSGGGSLVKTGTESEKQAAEKRYQFTVRFFFNFL